MQPGPLRPGPLLLFRVLVVLSGTRLVVVVDVTYKGNGNAHVLCFTTTALEHSFITNELINQELATQRKPNEGHTSHKVANNS